MSETTDNQHKILLRANALLDALTHRDYRHVNLHFDSVMTDIMPPDRVEELWNTVLQAVGPFEDSLDSRVESLANEGHMVILTARFERNTIDIQVAFDRDAKITALTFAPANRPHEEASVEHETTEPSYESESAVTG